jgi:outer membrane receptor protein involved in Fe transport
MQRALASTCLCLLAAAPAPALADDAADTEDQQVIIVTGERIARSVQETASSVAVVTGEDLRDRAGADSINEVLAFTPNVQTGGAQNNGPTIRGQNSTGILSGVNAFLGGSRPRTTILVDGRPLSFNEFIFGETGAWDIAQIEVFLGPQTTSQGPNSVAGIINVRTNDPTYEREAAARAIIANYDTYQLSGMVNVPIVEDQVALRIAADWRDHDTFLALPEDQPIGVDPEEDSFTTLRAKLLVEPEALPGFRGLFIYNYADSLGPQVEQIRVPPPRVEARIHPGFEPVSFASETHTIVADVSQEIGDRLTLGNRFTYADAHIQRFSPPGLGVADIERDELTNETLLTYGEAGDALSGVTGLYYQKATSDEFIDLAGFGLGNGIFTDKTRSIGVFGEATVSPIDRLFLTGGVRYQSDNQDRDGGFTVLPPIVFDRTFDAWLPKLGVAYDFSDDLRVGFEARRGYNPGGVTLSFFTGEVDTFEEERLWNYELYWRSSLMGDRLTLNGNIFYTDFEDAQRPVNRVVNGNVITELAAAEDAKTYGAEIQLSYVPTDRLALDFGLGLLQTEIERVTGEPSLEGNEFERAPGVTAAIGARFEPIDNLTLSAQGRYVDDYFSDDANTPAFRIGSYFIANAQIAYQWGPARLFAFATNIFDEFTLLQQFDAETANVNDPREYGAGLELRF